MYLDVTFKDGTVSHCVLTQLHTIQIVNPQAQIQDAFSLDGVESIALNAQGNPAATDPAPPDFSGAAEGATLPDASAVAEEPAVDPTPSSPEPASDAPAPSDTPSSDAGATPSDASTPPEDPSQTDDHAVAADAAAVTVEAAQNVVASDAPAPDKQAQIQSALADVETALAQFPDSPQLQDAKAQLEALAGEITSA